MPKLRKFHSLVIMLSGNIGVLPWYFRVSHYIATVAANMVGIAPVYQLLYMFPWGNWRFFLEHRVFFVACYPARFV